MIPKIIHCCWFGQGDKTELEKQCVQSWKRILPDYQIIEWNEDNFDVTSNQYVYQAYQRKKYAFVADFVRLKALYDYGGIYMDLDVEVFKKLDKFLKYDAVFGFESSNIIASSIIFSEPRNNIIKRWLDSYGNRTFSVGGKEDLTANVYEISNILSDYGFNLNGITQVKNNVVVFERNYFSPYGAGDKKKSYHDSYAVHWCEGSWFGPKMKIKIFMISVIKRIIGSKNYYTIRNKFAQK